MYTNIPFSHTRLANTLVFDVHNVDFHRAAPSALLPNLPGGPEYRQTRSELYITEYRENVNKIEERISVHATCSE